MMPETRTRPSSAEIALYGHICQECLSVVSDDGFLQTLVSAWSRGRLTDSQAYWLVRKGKVLENSRSLSEIVNAAIAYVAAGNYDREN